MQRAIIITLFALSLLFPGGAYAAGEGGGANMRAICINYLNTTGALAEIISAASAQSVEESEIDDMMNYTHGEGYRDALVELQRANASVARMRASGFYARQADDLYAIGEQWFEGQAALELSGGRPSFTFVFDKTQEIRNLERQAYSANDELGALDLRISEVGQNIDLSDVKRLQAQAKKEFSDGRFNEAQRVARQAYEAVNDAEAEAAHSQTVVEIARRNIENFIEENWKTMLAIALTAGVLFFLFQKRIRYHLIESRIRSLAGERAVLEMMLQNLQKEYFQHGKLNEMSYHIKTKKYGDLIRSINRQLPLLKEELKRI